MPKDARDVAGALLRKGFVERPGDHRRFTLVIGGKKRRVTTKISHGSKEIGDNLLGVMARQMNLSNREFRKFIDCDMTGEGYESLMREREVID